MVFSKRVILIAVVFSSLWSVLPAAAEGGPTPAELKVARGKFEKYCSACHGKDGRGGGPAAPSLKTPPPDLTKIARRRGGAFPDAEVAAYIDGRTKVAAHGTREMPIWGEQFSRDIPDQEIGEEIARGKLVLLVDYLRSIQR